MTANQEPLDPEVEAAVQEAYEALWPGYPLEPSIPSLPHVLRALARRVVEISCAKAESDRASAIAAMQQAQQDSAAAWEAATEATSERDRLREDNERLRLRLQQHDEAAARLKGAPRWW